MSGAESPGGSRGAGPAPMEEDPQPQQQGAPNGVADEQAPSQSQRNTPQGQRRAPRAPPSPGASQPPQGTPLPARRPAAQPQPQPSGSFLQGSYLQGGASEGTMGGAGGATPLPRGLAAQNRGEFGGRAARRPNVRIGTGGKPAPTMSGSMMSGQQPQGTGADDVPGAAEGEELPPANDGAADEGTFVWGTNINSRYLRQQIDGFIRTFRPAGADSIASPKYVQIIKEAIESGEASVNIDTADMRAVVDDVSYNDLYDTLVDFPREVHCVLDEVVREVAVLDLMYEPTLDRQQAMDLCLLVCRPYNLAATKHIRDLDPTDIDKLVCIKGMVTRTSAIIPNLRYAVFECAACGHEVATPNVNGRVEDPTSCPSCKKKWSMALQHNKGSYTDKQLIKMQESPNDIPEGETPMGVTLYTYDTLVDVARPGDRVTITGMYRAAPFRANPRQAALHALFRTYLDVVHIHRDETRRLFSTANGADAKTAEAEPTILSAPNTPADSQQVGGGAEAAPSQADGAGSEEQFVAIENITAEELQEVEGKIKELSRDPRLVERLIASLAPNIWEMEDIKKGVLCQLFGGTPKVFAGGKIRSELNVLLVGDPSVSKSQLLTYVHQLAPRGIYTSGKGSSAVGLTAYVTKDPETKEMVLESGALVLSDRGVCCIDEFDKMSDSARSMLHEAMEQQTVSVAKAGLISTLNARCSVLACANPVGSRYNPQLSIADNINLPPTLLTRFDLIYLVLDRYEEARDRRLARHLVSLFHPGAQNRSRAGGAGGPLEPVSPDLLKKYIAYARAKCLPKLTDEAAEELVNRYQTLRRDGRERKVVMATPRQLESLIRISESLARMRLDERIRATDVAEAVRLWYGAMAGSAGSGSSDGRPDLDTLYCGTTAAQRAAARALPEELRGVISGMRLSHTLSVDDLLREINSRLAAAAAQQQQQHGGGGGGAAPGGVSRSMLITALRQLDDLVLYDETTNTVRPILRGSQQPNIQAQKEAVEAAGAAQPVLAS
ncbi:hypothetical protein PLESTB_000350900 [Pleodorina starrii]|uniref:DNA helicase n=1 Tax=Pleodorina starrii TaxID=330485 RepID=A0A9W6BDK2_9CHLO|nr:hypothetical protein PLESTM_000044200 [Pleodorina starrii]GLC50177.1 hypothetical protein PLESTB_000350900 [Pleodorina starrii]GLC73045.1 hypothetical protein PLESTF_001325700 [Pleodorina starrii]